LQMKGTWNVNTEWLAIASWFRARSDATSLTSTSFTATNAAPPTIWTVPVTTGGGLPGTLHAIRLAGQNSTGHLATDVRDSAGNVYTLVQQTNFAPNSPFELWVCVLTKTLDLSKSPTVTITLNAASTNVLAFGSMTTNVYVPLTLANQGRATAPNSTAVLSGPVPSQP